MAEERASASAGVSFSLPYLPPRDIPRARRSHHCVRGARVQRGDQRTEPRRLSGVSSRPAKVGAAGTRLALWNAGTFWTRHLGISQRAALLRSSRQRLPRRPTHFLHNKALSSSSRQDIPAADLPRAADLRRRIFSFRFLLREFVCAVVLRFRSWASGIMPVPSS